MAGEIGFLGESSIKKRQFWWSSSSNGIKAETVHRVHLRGGVDGDVGSVLEQGSTAILSVISPRQNETSVFTLYKQSLLVTSKCTAGMPLCHLTELWPWKIYAISKLVCNFHKLSIKLYLDPNYTELSLHKCSASPEWRAPQSARWPPRPPSGWAPGPGWGSLGDKAAACGSSWMAGRTAGDSRSTSPPPH